MPRNGLLPLSGVNKTIAVLGSACEPKSNTNEMLETWDLGNYYTVGGSGRVISKNPVSGGSGVGGHQYLCLIMSC